MAPTKQQEREREDQEHRGRERVTARVAQGVLRLLGEPAGLLAVQVRPLWEGRYRVNVLVGPDASSARVAHSYFLAADGDGNVVTCAPKITKCY
jgi:hypothetical protein